MSKEKAALGAIRERCDALEAQNRELHAKQKKLSERVTAVAVIGAVTALLGAIGGAYVSCRRLPSETDKLRAEVASLGAQAEKSRAESAKALAETQKVSTEFATQREPNFELTQPALSLGANNATVSWNVKNLKQAGLTILFYGVRVWEPNTTIDEIERAPRYENVDDAEVRVRRDAVNGADNGLVELEDGHTIGAGQTGPLSVRLRSVPAEGALVEVFVYVAEHRDGLCTIAALPNAPGKRPETKPPIDKGKACYYDVKYGKYENAALSPL